MAPGQGGRRECRGSRSSHGCPAVLGARIHQGGRQDSIARKGWTVSLGAGRKTANTQPPRPITASLLGAFLPLCSLSSGVPKPPQNAECMPGCCYTTSASLLITWLKGVGPTTRFASFASSIPRLPFIYLPPAPSPVLSGERRLPSCHCLPRLLHPLLWAT